MTFLVKVNCSETTTPQYKAEIISEPPRCQNVPFLWIRTHWQERVARTDTQVHLYVLFAKSDFKITCSRRSDSRARCSDGGGSEFINRTWRKPRRGEKTRWEWSITFIFSRQSFDRALLFERLEQANLKGGILSRVKHLCLVNVLS